MNTLAQSFLATLRQTGHRITRVRESIINLLASFSKPLGVPDLVEALKKQGLDVNKTTVYREIEFLQSQNIVKSILLGEDKKRYELVGDDHHHHLICLNCEQIQDVELHNDLNQEEKHIQQEKNFKITRHSLEFFGLCAKCQG